MIEQAPTPAPKRRWFRFSLRGLLILVTVVAIVAGGLAWAIQNVPVVYVPY